MDSKVPDTAGEEVAVALQVEDRLGQLAAGVGAVGVVTSRQGQVIEVDLGAHVGVGHDVDDAAGGALLQLVHQQQRQVGVAQVVDA